MLCTFSCIHILIIPQVILFMNVRNHSDGSSIVLCVRHSGERPLLIFIFTVDELVCIIEASDIKILDMIWLFIGALIDCICAESHSFQ